MQQTQRTETFNDMRYYTCKPTFDVEEIMILNRW